MPKFRVSGVFHRDFVVEVEAKSKDDAIDLVGQFSLNDFDATSYVDSDIDDCIELDEDGDEIDTPLSEWEDDSLKPCKTEGCENKTTITYCVICDPS